MMEPLKELLKELWIAKVRGEASDKSRLEDKFGVEILRKAADKGLIEVSDGEVRITGRGRKRLRIVACGGVFDILHPGHGFFLEKAKSHGDVLIVVVARDSTVEKRKRIPVVPEKQRLEMVSYLKPVDVAVLGGEGDPLKIIENLGPDVIVLGPDQKHDEKELRDTLRKRGIDVRISRVNEYKNCPLYSTRSILEKIIERGYPK